MVRVPLRADTSGIIGVLTCLPEGIRRILGQVPFVIDTKPAWIGLHSYDDPGDNRNRQETTHVYYDFGQSHLPADRRETTVILLKDRKDGYIEERVILHELGHVLDQRLGFKRPEVKPLDDYAAIDGYEAFATAFQSWATLAGINETYFHTRKELWEKDRAACIFFDHLARG